MLHLLQQLHQFIHMQLGVSLQVGKQGDKE